MLLRFQRMDVLIALGVAGLINLAMMFVAASLFHHTGIVVYRNNGSDILVEHEGRNQNGTLICSETRSDSSRRPAKCANFCVFAGLAGVVP